MALTETETAQIAREIKADPTFNARYIVDGHVDQARFDRDFETMVRFTENLKSWPVI